MKLDSEQIRKLKLFSYNPNFLDSSKEIICDYIYASRECSLIYLTPIELDMLLTYSSKSISKRRVDKIIDMQDEEKIINDFDDFMFFGKLLKDAYKFSDGIMIKNHIYKQKKLYTFYHRYQEVLDLDAIDDMSYLKEELSHKKVLYISFNENYKPLPFANVIELKIDHQELNEYKSWLEWLDVIKMRIMIQEFDVAIINLGIYSNILNYFIAQTLHKIAITKGDEESAFTR